tara:strand:+ start:7195 stop:7665 length:471 start_codon:yes stop_codon:yes gene_type:complete
MKKALNRQKLLLIAFIVAFIDQLSKLFIVNTISNFNGVLLIPYLVQLSFIKNTGAAFNLFKDLTFLLTLLSISVTIILISWIWNNHPFTFFKGLGFSFLLGGTIGNGLDRLRLGYVIDFIELIPIDFPVFNFADISINLAVLMLIIDMFTNKGIRK